MSSRAMLIFAAISGFVYVVLGASEAHILGNTVGEAKMAWMRTGLEYQALHTLVLIGLATAMLHRANIWFYWSGAFLALGTLLFSGSLYGLALSHLRLWGFITPIGGICFLTGWALMLSGALRMKKRAGCSE